AENKEMAWEFIKMVSLDPEVQLGSFELDAMFPSLLETYDDALFEEPEPFLGGQKARLMWQDVALRIPQVITNENDRIAENIMGTALSQVLEDGRDVEEALAEAKTLIERRLR
ncbi:MAG TPA: sugar ABC transporter substrate-binding protein, partial [Halanaerobiales bacterium]|nr:sugar ABC transporter substrate-binding protein [Halanaerobiales bacterium]